MYTTYTPSLTLLLLVMGVQVTLGQNQTQGVLPYDDPSYALLLSPGCKTYMASLVASGLFNRCGSFGHLLTGSMNFQRILQNASNVPALLAPVCAPQRAECAGAMGGWGANITADSACGADIQGGAPVATSAWISFVQWEMMQSAGCTRNGTGAYCLQDATDHLSSALLYKLPYNVNLSVGDVANVNVACSTCNSQVLRVFYNALTSGHTQGPLPTAYVRTQATLAPPCGPAFASVYTLQVTAAASRGNADPLLLTVIVCLSGLYSVW